MHYTIQNTDINILRKAGMCEDDIMHSTHVAEKALELANRINDKSVNQEIVGRGALFHDLGKTKTHAMEHGKIGAELGKALGLPDEINAIMEKHIRGGLTGPEAKALNLPIKDYTLNRLEERIVIYADRLVDIIYDGVVSVKNGAAAEEQFEHILRTYPNYGKNDITLARYLGYHQEIQRLMKKA
jgi:uncharacterized protein